MHRSYTTRLNPTKRQDALLTGVLAQNCELYNCALEERIGAWKTSRKSLTLYDQQKELTQLRAVEPEYAAMPVAIQRDPLQRLQRAFDGFFRRIKAGQTPGFPRFRSQSRYDSFTVDSQSFRIEGNTAYITKLGGFRFKVQRRMKGIPKTLCISRCGHKWKASFGYDIGPAPEKIAVRNAVGIDVGLTTLVTLSDGTEIANPRWTRQEEDRLADANRSLSRKIRGSKNRLKTREFLRRCHQRIAGKRASYLTGVAKQLVSQYDLIAYEDLKIQQMVEDRLAKSILDAAWHQLIWRLHCEAEYAGKWIIPVNPRNTTQNCSGCGEKVPKTLWQRKHDCPHCGLSLGRDLNASRNILQRGMLCVAQAAGESK